VWQPLGDLIIFFELKVPSHIGGTFVLKPYLHEKNSVFALLLDCDELSKKPYDGGI
jgi:hypothetical protein